MRKIITWVATTLDGYMEGPDGEGDLGWLVPYVAESIPDNSRLLGEEIDTILLGRITYQGFSQYWPFEKNDFADLMNTPPKLVFSSPGALEKVSWGTYDNATVVDHDVEETLRELKAKDGKDLVILASGGLVSSLLGTGLIDELRIVVCPVVLGAGKTYFRDIKEQVGLELVGVKTFPAGSALLTYRSRPST
jgi:dihydrofolate reductase